MSPGVGFFYGGLARSKNIVNVLGMTLIVMGLMSVQWILWGYSLAFAPNADEGAQLMRKSHRTIFQELFVNSRIMMSHYFGASHGKH
jgi:ammonia channel protein AmtB